MRGYLGIPLDESKSTDIDDYNDEQLMTTKYDEYTTNF